MQRRTFVAALTASPMTLWAHAQGAYPEKPIKLIVGFPPGDGIDFTARTIMSRARLSVGRY